MVSASADLELIRASMLLESDPAGAARRAGEMLARWPLHEEAGLLLATACRKLGDTAQALATIEPLARANPSSPVMQLELGRIYATAGDGAQATSAFQHALKLDAALADAWRELAAQRFLAGDLVGGDAAYREYCRRAPASPELTDAHVAVAEGRLAAAEALVQARLSRAPDDTAALRLLADVAARREHHVEAEKLLATCLMLAPGYAAARYDMARVLAGRERADEALPHIERLLATEPHNPVYISLKAQTIRLLGRSAEAIQLLEQLVVGHPDDPEIWVLRGNLLREAGDQPRAVESYRRALAVSPAHGEAYWCLANLKTLRFATSEIADMQREIGRSAALGHSRIALEFALGKALEDAGEFADSFEHYAHGNALQRGTLDYDTENTSSFVRRSRATYTGQFFADRAGWGTASADPIFVVGLPRSGSTLIEQILASHPMVEGTRELLYIPDLVNDLALRVDRAGGEYPVPVATLGRAEIYALAQRYSVQTQAQRPLGRARFVDKMLGNFNHVGLLHLMFPHASIIDVLRQPLASGFACYKQLFSRRMNFSYDLEELGSYYRHYADLMQHFDAVLPGRVYRIRYENLVAEPEREIRRLLEHCALPFDAGCLRFYDNPRIVQTVSSEQVRRPIYGNAVDHWRNYEAWLGPLKQALGDLVGP